MILLKFLPEFEEEKESCHAEPLIVHTACAPSIVNDWGGATSEPLSTNRLLSPSQGERRGLIGKAVRFLDCKIPRWFFFFFLHIDA